MSKEDEQKKALDRLAEQMKDKIVNFIQFVETDIVPVIDTAEKPVTKRIDHLKELIKENKVSDVLVTLLVVIAAIFRDDAQAHKAVTPEQLKEMPEALRSLHGGDKPQSRLPEATPTLLNLIDLEQEAMSQYQYHTTRKVQLSTKEQVDATHDVRIKKYEDELKEVYLKIFSHLDVLLGLTTRTFEALMPSMPENTRQDIKALVEVQPNIAKLPELTRIKLARYFLLFTSVTNTKKLAQ